MKKIIILLFILPFTLFAQEKPTQKEIVINKLRILENKYFSYLSFDERREAIKLMDEIIEIVNPKQNPQIEDEEPRIQLNLMSSEEFTKFYSEYNDRSSRDEKIDYILEYGIYYNFTCFQIKKLVESIGIGDQQADVIKILYKKIIDPENIQYVVDAVFGNPQYQIKNWIAKQIPE